MATAIDRALAKLDEILASAGAASGPATVSKPLAVRAVPAVPSASSISESSSSRPGSSVNVAAAGAAAGGSTGRQILTSKAQIKVARVTSAVKQPNSAKLLKLQADLGEGDVRQIMAGLAQYYPDPSSLEGVLVCVAANLKTAKLAGEPSQAMVLAAEATGPEGQTIVKALQPPVHACPGDLVHLDGVMPPESFPKVLKLDEWKQVVPGLVVQGGKATFEGTPLVTSQGLVTLPAEIPDGSEIH